MSKVSLSLFFAALASGFFVVVGFLLGAGFMIATVYGDGTHAAAGRALPLIVCGAAAMIIGAAGLLAVATVYLIRVTSTPKPPVPQQ